MARVFRATYTAKGRGGTRVTRTARKWYVEYRDADGIVRRKAGYTDKAATRQLAAELERHAIRRKAGLIDRFAEHRKRPLAEHLADYESYLRDSGASPHHVATVVPRVRKVLDGCQFTHWPDVSAALVQNFVGKLRKNGRSEQTCSFYLQAAKQFCRWMVRDGRAPDSPLAHLKGGNVRVDRRHDRRALSTDELLRLLAAAETGPIRFGMTGSDRAILYRLTVETGLRANELRTLTWGSFDLKADPPTVTVKAAYSKHRRDDVLPLKADSAKVLAGWRSIGERNLAELVFANLTNRTADMLRCDLRRARAAWIRENQDRRERRNRRRSAFLARVDESGRFVDFHALRHTFITNLARGGVHPKLAQALARHSTITLTMDRYSHTVIGEQADALAALPNLSENGPETNRQKATGTCDDSPKLLAFCLAERGASQAPLGSSRSTSRGDSERCEDSDNPLQPSNVRHGDSSCDNEVSQLRRTGFEPVTFGSVDRCSIQLS